MYLSFIVLHWYVLEILFDWLMNDSAGRLNIGSNSSYNALQLNSFYKDCKSELASL